MPSFVDRLVLGLSLKIGTDTFSLPGGTIKRMRLDVLPYGFDAELTFYVSSALEEDTLFPRFKTRDLIRGTVSITVPDVPPGADVPDPLVINGIVTEKKLMEIVGQDLTGLPVVLRAYTVHLADAAAVLWREHYPCELYTAATLKDVIDGQKPEGVNVTHDWGALEEERKILCVGLGAGEASFYDFVVWFIRAHGGVLEFDTSQSMYRIGGEKTKDTTPAPIYPEDIEEVRLAMPEARRDTVRVVNPFSEGAATSPQEQAFSTTGVRRDVVMHTPIAADFERRGALEKQKLRLEEEGAELYFRRFPRSTFRPGKQVTFGEPWSPRTRAAAKPYRVVSLHVSAEATEGSARVDADLEEDSGLFEIEARAVLELASSPAAQFPEITPPKYPIYVEGKIVSAGGGDDDRTWMPIDDEKNALTYYRVDIPLWNKKIDVPFEPGFWPGHFFFPAYKNERVLIALGFAEGRISRFLDWAANARLPADSQGNQIVFGKRAADGTTMEHIYVDNKPLLRVKRTLGQDVETLEVSEGRIYFEVKEDQTAQAVEPKYDVTLEVEAAKGQVATQVGASVAGVTGQFEGAMGGVNASMESATAELDASLGAMESELGGRIDAVKAELDALASGMESTAEAMGAAVASAKAEILAAVSG